MDNKTEHSTPLRDKLFTDYVAKPNLVTNNKAFYRFGEDKMGQDNPHIHDMMWCCRICRLCSDGLLLIYPKHLRKHELKLLSLY